MSDARHGGQPAVGASSPASQVGGRVPVEGETGDNTRGQKSRRPTTADRFPATESDTSTPADRFPATESDTSTPADRSPATESDSSTPADRFPATESDSSTPADRILGTGLWGRNPNIGQKCGQSGKCHPNDSSRQIDRLNLWGWRGGGGFA